MESGGLEVGRVFARLDGKFDDNAFKRYDRAVDKAKAQSRSLSTENERLRRSTSSLTTDQERQVKSLRDAGNGWGVVARRLGLTGKALREYQTSLKDATREQDKVTRSTETLTRAQIKQAKTLRDNGVGWQKIASTIGVSEEALRSWNTTSRTTQRESERTRRSNRDTERSFFSLDGAVARVNRTMTFFRTTIRILKWPALIAGVGAALQGVNALTGGVVALVSALAPLSGLLVTLPAALGTFGQVMGVSLLGVSGVKDAVKALNDEQTKSGGVAEDAAKRQRAAASQIRSAEEQLGDAQRSSADAQDGLNEARRSAVESLQDMRNAAIEARLGEQGAQMALRRAISDLWKAEADPKSSLLDLEELELRVRDSRQALKEARIENRRAQVEDRRGQKGGVKGDPGVLDARRALADANRDVSRSARGLAEAERDANESLSETGSTVSKVEEAFSGLNPEAAKFSRFLFGLKPQLEGMQRTAAKGFLPGAEKGITAAIRNLPIVEKVIGGTSRVMGTLSERAGKLFGSKGFGKDFETIGRGNSRTLGLMGRSAEHLTKGLTNVLVVAQPFLRWVGKTINHFSAYIEKSTEVNRKNGDMAKFFGRTRQVVEVLGSIFQSLGATLGVIGEEAAPLGRQMLKAFDEGAEGLERWSESTKGRDSIAQYFKDAKGPLWEAGRLVRDIVKAFFELGDGEGMDSIENLIHQLRVELLPVFTDMTKETTATFGPHFISALTQVLGLFGRLAGETGPLTLYVDALGGVAKVTNWFIDNVPGFHSVATGLIGITVAMKTMDTVGKWTGITKGLEMAFGPELGGRLKTRFTKMMKDVMLRGAAMSGIVTGWASEVGGQMATGITRQTTKIRAAGRRLAISFLSIFVPEVAAGMAAGGRFGEALSAAFPRIAAMFKKGGRMAGRAFVVGAVLGLALIGWELGKAISRQIPNSVKFKMGMWGEGAAEAFINTFIKLINDNFNRIEGLWDKANPLGKLGVDAPNIPDIPEVGFNRAEDALRASEEEPSGQRSRREVQRRTPKRVKQKERRESKQRTQGMSEQDHREAYEALWGEPPPSGPPPWPPPRQLRSTLGGRPGSGASGYTGSRQRRGGARDEVRRQGKDVTDEHKRMRRGVEDEAEGMQRGVLSRFQKMRKGSVDESRRMDKAVSDATSNMRGKNDKATRAMLGDTNSRFEDMGDTVATRSKAMSDDLGGNVDEMSATTREGMDMIQAAVTKALKAFGVKNVDLDLTPGKAGGKGPQKSKPAAAATGAVFTVPGEGLQDSVYLPGVHAMVAPGENLFAATRHQQPLLDFAVESALGVQGGLDGFFSTYNRPHCLAEGGRATAGGAAPRYTGPNAGGLSQGILTLAGWMQKLFGHTISSGARPWDTDSEHSTGNAADFAGGDFIGGSKYLNKFRAVLNQGIYNPAWFGGDPVSVDSGQTVPTSFWGSTTWEDHKDHHHASVPGSGRALSASGPRSRGRGIPKIPMPMVKGPKGAMRALAQAAMERTTWGANAYVRRRAGAGGMAAQSLKGYDAPDPGIIGDEEFLEIARLALKITGHGDIRGGARKLLTLAKQESSLNTKSINNWDSNAKMGNPSGGLMHTTETTFQAYHEPGTAKNYFDPLASIASSINYQFDTYGGLVTHSPYARGGPILRRFASGGKGKPEFGVSQRRGAVQEKRRPPKLSDSNFAEPPNGPYAPAALLQIAAATGIGLPYKLLDEKGIPNWRALPVSKYGAMVKDYLRRVAEYRKNLGEERTSAEEGYLSNPMLSSVIALSPNTISEAVGYHSPIRPDTDAYQTGYSALGTLDQRAEATRQSYLNTFSEGYLAPVEQRRTEITSTRDRILASLNPEREAKEFARARLKGLQKRVKRKQNRIRKALKGKTANAKTAKQKAAIKKRTGTATRRVARVATRKTRQQIKQQARKVKGRATRRGAQAEATYEEGIETLLDPVEAEREELERRNQFESARREELAPLLSEIASNVQRTANVGRVQSRLFAPPTFARGGRLPAGTAQAVAAPVNVGAPNVTVPLAVRLSGALEALNPQIQAVVDGKLKDMGQAAGGARMTVSAPGRRVSYGGK